MTSKRVGFWTGPNSVTFTGGIVGLLAFLVVGLLPSLLYGGYAGVIIGSAIFGSPIHENVLAQATVVLGVLSGVLSVGSIFVLAGAILATGIQGMGRALKGASEESQAPTEAEVPIQ